jgi:hypothetical protein
MLQARSARLVGHDPLRALFLLRERAEALGVAACMPMNCLRHR